MMVRRRRQAAAIARPAILVAASAALIACPGGRGGSTNAAPAPADSARAQPAPPAPSPAAARVRLPRIDVHTHVGPEPETLARLSALMDRWGIDGVVNLSGMYPGPPEHMLEMQLAAAGRTGHRMAVFANANFRSILSRNDYGRAMAADLAESRRLGAIGLKIPKGLGLGYPARGGKGLLAVDDKGLDPLFEKAGALGMPVAIHTGDPKAFWRPATPDNERWDELQAHPSWSFHGAVTRDGKPVPSWEELYDALERRVTRHPKTIFIAVHFGNAPEEPDRVARMLDRYPNFYIDTAARVPEIGRHAADKMRAFFTKYQDRILFGTDTGVGPTQDDMMYGSNGALPPTADDERLFFTATDRYFETLDRQFASPTPIQGRWKIDGIGLPESVLRKVYFDNAVRLLRWRPGTGTGAPAPL